MRKICFVILMSILALVGKSQNRLVQNSFFGVQASPFGLWGHYEKGIGKTMSLRFEVGLDATVYRPAHSFGDPKVFGPVLSIEPRYYFDISQRKKNGKKIENNTGSFVSIRTVYSPGMFVIAKDKNLSPADIGSLLPTIGYRNQFAGNFNCELGLGYGPLWDFTNTPFTSIQDAYIISNLYLRIGYTF